MANRKPKARRPAPPASRPAPAPDDVPVISLTNAEVVSPSLSEQVTVPRFTRNPKAAPERAPSSDAASGLSEWDDLVASLEDVPPKDRHRHPPAPALSGGPRQPSMPRAAQGAQASAPSAPPVLVPTLEAPEPCTEPTMRLVLPEQSPRQDNPDTRMGRIYPDTIYRFRFSERLLHWSIATPFLVCLGTAAILFFVYNRYPQIPYRAIFSWAHKISGAALIALPLLAIVTNLKDIKIHLSNIREGWSWSLNDVKWLALMPLAIISKRVKLPEEGKFNAGEKLNFMASMGSYAVMGSTGVLLWLDPVALGLWFVHLATAAALLPLIGGHIFMAVINPASRVGLSGMFTGWVNREWASHHYRRWYRQIIARHMKHHGHVPELDTTEHDVLKPDENTRRRTLVRARWLVAGASMGLAVAAALGVASYALRDQLSHSAGMTLYLAEDQPLMSRPATDSPPVAGEPLRRGAQVLRLAVSGDFALVQDALARAGYVRKEALVQSAPKAVPAGELPACVAVAGEARPEQCEACAGARRDACVQACPESRKVVCSGICEERHAAAIEACRPAPARRE